MSIAAFLSETNKRMDKALESLKVEFATIRTGRASPSLVENISINYYDTKTPIKQLASISTPDPKMIVIEPWDKSVLPELERTLSQSDLGVTPMSDGKVIRIALPHLTTERREEFVKKAKKIVEDHKVSLRSIRREANDEIKKMQKEGSITEDELFQYQEDVQKRVDAHIKQLDVSFTKKESEIKES